MNLPIKEFTIWWQLEREGTIRSLAKELGITTATIYYWLRGKPVPLKYLKRIEELSDGAFPRQYIRPDRFPD